MATIFNGKTLDSSSLGSFEFTNTFSATTDTEELFNTGLSSLGAARAYDQTKADGKEVFTDSTSQAKNANGQGTVTAPTGFAAQRIVTIQLFRVNQWISLLPGETVTIVPASKEEEVYFMNMIEEAPEGLSISYTNP